MTDVITPIFDLLGRLTGHASIAAGGGGGGGVPLDGPVYDLQYNAGTATIPDRGGLVIPFDTLSDGVTDAGGGNFTVPSGIYLLTYDIEPSMPAENRWGAMDFEGSSAPTFGPAPSTTVYITSFADSYSINGSNFYGQVMLSTASQISVNVRDFGSTAGGGADLTMLYAEITLAKIG